MSNQVRTTPIMGTIGITMAFCLIVLQGCTNPAPVSTPASNAETAAETPKAAMPESAAPEVLAQPPLNVAAMLADIGSAKSLLAWYQIRLAYETYETKNGEIESALAAREKELSAESTSMPISEALDLIEVNWQLDGDDVSEEGKLGTFRLLWLFRVKDSIPMEADQDIKLVLRAWIDKAHQQYFEGDKRFLEFTYDLVPPLSDWEVGSYQLVDKLTYAKIPNVPYRLHTFFSISKKSEAGKWTYVGPYGKSIDNGWHADAGTIPEPVVDAAEEADVAETDTTTTEVTDEENVAPKPAE